VSELAPTFTRTLPIAASGDAAWARVPFGAAGDAVVTLTIDAQGTLVSWNTNGAPSPALAAAVTRTMSLLKSRTFVAHGATTRLRIHAQVSPDSVHDGLHGDVFALGASFTSRDGSAFFALAVGRRIDVRITELR
jgi:hypothetical protein